MAMLSGLITTTEEPQPTGEFPQLQLPQIRRDGGTQPREGINQEHVDNMVATLEGGGSLPPVEVMYDGTAYWLVNGFHRCAAHEKHGTDHIAVIIKQGTLDDAKWESLGANKELPRTQREIERNVKDALRHPRSQGMSNRSLAAHLGIDHKTVGKYRNELQSVGEIPQLNRRIGTDGKSYSAEANRVTTAEAKDLMIRCREIEYWLLGKGWGMHRSSQGDGVSKGAHQFSWGKGDYADALDKLKEAKKIEQAEREQAKSMTDTARPLTFDETMSLVWRVVKSSVSGAPTPFIRWSRYKDWLETNQEPKDYKHELPEGTKLDGQILINARIQIIMELIKNLETAKQTRALTLDETIALIWRVLKLDGPKGEPTTAERLHWLNLHALGNHYEHALNEGVKLDFATFGPAWATVANELRRTVEHEQRTKERAETHQKAVERTDVLNGPIAETPTPAPNSAPTSQASEPETRTRNERIRGLINMLETTSMALEAEYGDLTGCFTHVPPAKRNLETMIGQLKLQQTREG